MKAHYIHVRLALLLPVTVLISAFVQPRPVLAYATSWQFPLGGDGYTYIMPTHEKYGTTVVNTRYNVRNLELISTRDAHITCFGVGWHSLYHAGVDFYRQGSSAANATVKAIADGTVVYASVAEHFPGQAVIIRHDVSGGQSVYSVYEHLNLPMVVSGTTVFKGQQIASILP